MKLKLAHYRNRFSMFRTYYALRTGLVKTDGLEFEIVEVPDPPSRELEDVLIRGEVDISNVYLPNFLERRLTARPSSVSSPNGNRPAKATVCSCSRTGSARRPSWKGATSRRTKAVMPSTNIS